MRRLALPALLALGLAFGLSGLAAAQDPTPSPAPSATPPGEPPQAVVYTEFPVQGPFAEDPAGRRLGNGGLRAGIDIDSRVAVDVRSTALREALDDRLGRGPAEGDTRLSERLAALRQAVEAAGRLVEAYRVEIELYNRVLTDRAESGLASSVIPAELNQATARRASLARQVLLPLRGSLVARLGSEDRADAALQPVLVNRPPGHPYDMEALGALLAEEIESVEARLAERLTESTYQLAIVGHIVRPDGSKDDIPVPGYNDVAPGPATPFQRINLELSPEEQALQQQYLGLVADIEAARESGADLLDAIRSAFDSDQIPIVRALRGAEEAVETAGGHLEALVRWSESGSLEAWAAGPALEAVAESAEMEAAWESFQVIARDAGEDLDTLRSLGEAAQAVVDLADSRPAAALEVLFSALAQIEQRRAVSRALSAEVWRERLERLGELLSEELPGDEGEEGGFLLDSLAEIDGPVRDWQAAREAIEGVREALATVDETARVALAEIQGGAFAVVTADLPEPEGQKILPIARELSTEIDLLTLPVPRDEGDTVQLTYRLYDGEEELADLGWTDRLAVRAYGWRGRARASIALVRFDEKGGGDGGEDGEGGGGGSDMQWEPTAPISYLFWREKWPEAGESGLGRTGGKVPFTFGLSTMALDFSDDEDIEVGLAATVGLWDDLALVGYGINLQADEEPFFFFAFRPFSLKSLGLP